MGEIFNAFFIFFCNIVINEIGNSNGNISPAVKKAASGDKSMTELAYECGFSSLATFYRAKKARADIRAAKNKTDK